MTQKGLEGFFEKYLSKESLFKDKNALQSNYSPETIPHRDNQIKEIAAIFAPTLKSEKPSNLFLYGKTGTGKTISIKYVSTQLKMMAEKKNTPLKIIYVNCKLKKVADTEYRLMAQLAREFGKDIPVTGLPTDEIYNIFFQSMDETKMILILVLDEIDELVKKTGDRLLYNLTRINAELKNSQLSLVGISNNLTFSDSLDPRVKSSLSEEEIIFPPYNALQLQDILQERAKNAFKKNTISQGVISKCAAYAARDHGDARRALDLLRVAGEVAERSNTPKVELEHIDEAEGKIERDRMIEIAATQPKQFQATLYSIIEVTKDKKQLIFAGEVYEYYKKLCQQCGLRPLTQRRLSDIVSELDMLGIITAKIISKGRYGRTREIKLTIPKQSQKEVKKVLETGLDLS